MSRVSVKKQKVLLVKLGWVALAGALPALASAATTFTPELAFQGVLRQSSTAYVPNGTYCAKLVLKNGGGTISTQTTLISVLNGAFTAVLGGLTTSAVNFNANGDQPTVDVGVDYTPSDATTANCVTTPPGAPSFTDTFSSIPIYPVPFSFLADQCNNLTTNALVGAANGGTGLATLTSNSLLAGNGTGTVNLIPPSTSGNVLTSNGTVWASAPLPTTLGGGASTVTISGGSGTTNIGTAGTGGINIGTGTNTGATIIGNTSGGTTTIAGATTIGAGASSTTTIGNGGGTVNIGTAGSDTVSIGNGSFTTNINGPVAFGAGVSGPVSFAGAVTMASTLGVTGAVAVTGNVTVLGSETVTGLETLNGGETVTGATIINGSGAATTNIATGSGGVVLGTGTGTVAIGNTSFPTLITGAAAVGGAMAVTGLTTLSGGENVSGPVVINGASASTTTIGGAVNGDLLMLAGQSNAASTVAVAVTGTNTGTTSTGVSINGTGTTVGVAINATGTGTTKIGNGSGSVTFADPVTFNSTVTLASGQGLAQSGNAAATIGSGNAATIIGGGTGTVSVGNTSQPTAIQGAATIGTTLGVTGLATMSGGENVTGTENINVTGGNPTTIGNATNGSIVTVTGQSNAGSTTGLTLTGNGNGSTSNGINITGTGTGLGVAINNNPAATTSVSIMDNGTAAETLNMANVTSGAVNNSITMGNNSGTGASTINIGSSGNASANTTITIGNPSAAGSAVNLFGGATNGVAINASGNSPTTIGGGGTGTINIGSGNHNAAINIGGSGNTSTITIGGAGENVVIGTGSTGTFPSATTGSSSATTLTLEGTNTPSEAQVSLFEDFFAVNFVPGANAIANVGTTLARQSVAANAISPFAQTTASAGLGWLKMLNASTAGNAQVAWCGLTAAGLQQGTYFWGTSDSWVFEANLMVNTTISPAGSFFQVGLWNNLAGATTVGAYFTLSTSSNFWLPSLATSAATSASFMGTTGASVAIAINTPQRLTMSYLGTSHVLSAYLNGTFMTSFTQTTVANTVSGQNFCIGAQQFATITPATLTNALFLDYMSFRVIPGTPR